VIKIRVKLKASIKKMEFFMIKKRLCLFIVLLSLLPLSAFAAKCREDFVEFKAEPAPRGHYVDTSGLTIDDIYNPDLTTGDDDVLYHPDMNIDL
jgi:hypothetical protein